MTSELNSAVSTFLHHGGGAKSASVNYGLFSGGGSNNRSQLNQSGSNHTLLDQYRDETLAERAKADPGTFIPLTVVDRYQTPTVPQPNLPVTRAGHALSRVGVSPTTVNDVIRSLAAKGEQVFLLIGMLGLLLSKRWLSKAGREYYYLCAAAIVVLVAVTVLPDLSVEYGVLRVFQQALILVAPVIVVGSLTLFQPLGRRWRQALAGGVGLAFFASTTGLIPQALGRYPAQLNLNNSGQYYDLYYMTPQQEAAVNWLAGKPGTLPGGVNPTSPPQRFAFNSPSSVTGRQYLTDLFPTFVERGSWVIADASMLATGTASVFVNGNIITYRYPSRCSTTRRTSSSTTARRRCTNDGAGGRADGGHRGRERGCRPRSGGPPGVVRSLPRGKLPSRSSGSSVLARHRWTAHGHGGSGGLRRAGRHLDCQRETLRVCRRRRGKPVEGGDGVPISSVAAAVTGAAATALVGGIGLVVYLSVNA